MDIELRTALDEIASAHRKYREQLNCRVTELEKKLEARLNREAFAMGGRGSRDDSEEMKAVDRFLRSGDPAELKVMSIDTDPAGGYLAPPQFASRIAEVGAEMGVMRQLAQVHTTDTGDYHIPVARTLAAAAWTSERGDRSETATPDLGQVHPAHGALYAVAPVTNWLLQDAAYDVAGFVARSIGEQFGVAESEAFAKGNGINRPMGILSYPFAEQGDATRPWGTIEEVRSSRDGEVAGAAGAEADPLITLLYKLAPRYRRNASWLAHPNAVEKMRKLKDTSGQYLWQPPLTVGQPATFLGLPVHEDVNLEAPATGSRSVLVGDFQRAYVITDIGRMTFVRDTVTKKGYTLFYFERRVGGALLDSNAVKALRLSA